MSYTRDNKLGRSDEFSITFLVEHIKHLTDVNFYGNVEIRFEKGKMVYIKKTETIKPVNISIRITECST